MKKPDTILKKYYEALDEGKILALKCKECGNVEWPPLPTCSKCCSVDMEWMEICGDAVIEEASTDATKFTKDFAVSKKKDSKVEQGATREKMRTKSDYFADGSYYISVGHLKEGSEFQAALFGINLDNHDEMMKKMPLEATAKIMTLKSGFKTVVFAVKE